MRWPLFGAVVAAQLTAGRDAGPRATRAIVALMLASTLADSRRRAPVAAAAAVGMVAEHVGTRTGRPFGRYRYSEKLGPRLGGVPLLAGAAWAMMARPAWAVAGRITRRRAGRVVLAAGALTAWDVFLDPRMVREGYWEWAGGGRYEDVPLSNFAGWLLTGLPLFALWSALDGEDDEEGAAVAMYLWTWAGETVANAIVWRRPAVAAAGALAMGAGGGDGLACAVRLAEAGHAVTVLEREDAPGGKCGRVEAGGFAWDSGPSLLTMPWVFDGLGLDLVRVEPVTRYEFRDGTAVELSADLPRAIEALEAWSPGAGTDWTRFLGVCAGMWRASLPFLTGPPPWPPRLDVRGDPRDLLRVKPWHTLRTLARGMVRDPRLRLVVERFATYAGADPRRTPAALALAGYVEHAFGAWHPRGGMHEVVRALVRRLEALGGELRLGEPVARVAPGLLGAEVVVSNVPVPGDSLSGLALMLGLRGRTPGLPHHTIRFSGDYDAEFDDVFAHRRPVRDPTLYVSCPEATEGGEDESWFVLVNAPAAPEHDWDAYAATVEARLGVDPARVAARALRTPRDYGPIYGMAPHGRLGTLRRPGQRRRDGVWRVGGTVHPGGGLPLVVLGAHSVARQIGPA